MLYLSLSVLVLWSPLQPGDESLLGGTFENRRLHLRVRPPAGWKIVSAGATADEPIEFWKEDENGPRIQITSYPYPRYPMAPTSTRFRRSSAKLSSESSQVYAWIRRRG